MPNWTDVQKMMREAQSPAEKAEAMQAFQEVIPPDIRGASMVTMSKGSNANVVRLTDLAQHSDNPEVFDRIKKLVGDR